MKIIDKDDKIAWAIGDVVVLPDGRRGVITENANLQTAVVPDGAQDCEMVRPWELSSPMVHRRTDGRLEVADTGPANDSHGCQLDDWCILANGHSGDCDEDRELWPGPGVEFGT